MTDPAQSLPPAELFDAEDLEYQVEAEPGQPAEYTAERILRDRPGVYHEVMRLRAQGLSIRAVKRLLGVHHRTIAAIEAREAPAMDTLRKQAAIGFRHAGRLALERILEILADPDSKVSAKDLGILAAISTDKAELLSGGATHRVELVTPRPAAQDWQEVIDIEPGRPEYDGPTDSGPEMFGQQAPAALPAPDQDPMPECLRPDSESVVSACNVQCLQGSDLIGAHPGTHSRVLPPARTDRTQADHATTTEAHTPQPAHGPSAMEDRGRTQAGGEGVGGGGEVDC